MNHIVFLRDNLTLYFSLKSLSALTVLFYNLLISSMPSGPIGRVELNFSAKVLRMK